MNETASLQITWRSALMLAVCVPVLLSALVLLWQKVENKAAMFLGLFLLVALIKVVPQIIGFSGFYAVWPGLTFAPFSIELFFGPLLLFHAHHLMLLKPIGQLKWLLIPGFIQLLYYCWAFLMLGDYKNKWAYNNQFHEPYIVPIEAVLGVILFVYCWGKIYQLSRNYETYLNHHQSTAVEFRPVWIQRLLVASLILLVLFIIVQIVPTFITDMSYIEEFPLVVLMMVILSWVGFEALRKLNQNFPKISAAQNLDHDQPVQAKSWSSEAVDLEQQMSHNQWYLSPRLSLSDLANTMGTNETYLSRTINQGLGLSFNQYINQWRVEHAKQLIKQPHRSLLNLAMDSGFNSKATFNRVFKTSVGLTPSQYKKSQQKSQTQ